MTDAIKENNKRMKNKKKFEHFKGFVIILASIIITILLVSFAPYRIVRISGVSMSPTLVNNDMVVCKKLYSPKNYTKYINYGDIVITSNKFKIIKRVVALPNDTVEFRNGYLYINDNYSNYNNEDNTPLTDGEMLNYKITLKSDEYYLLGDNRKESLDSRVYGPFNKFSYIYIKKFGK